MATIKIAKRVVDGAEPTGKRYAIFDSEIKGFGLRVCPSGKKSWIFEYRSGEGAAAQTNHEITFKPDLSDGAGQPIGRFSVSSACQLFQII